MHAARLLQKSMRSSLQFVQVKRWAALWSAVTALLSGGRLTLTELGRACRRDARCKHRVKQICRLLGNRHLHAELGQIYGAAAAEVLAGVSRPVVLVDWTPMGNKREHHALVASTPVGGRAAILYAEVHPERLVGARSVEKAFLKSLHAVLPSGCAPVIVTDAGFRTPWFDAVLELGWNFVGRLRHRTLYQRSSGAPWSPTRGLYSQATTKPQDLGAVVLTRSAPRPRRLVLVKAKSAPKRSKRSTMKTRPRRDYTGSTDKPNPARRYRKTAEDPWLLVTSLGGRATEVVTIYAARMQTEETFRDLKSHRFGWSFDDSRSRDPRRIEVLLLVAALATLALLLLGLAAENMKLHHGYQANTVRTRRVFSLTFLARILIRMGETSAVPIGQLRRARTALRCLVHGYADLAVC